MSETILSNRYRVLNVLGDGGFGQTFLVEDIQMPSHRRCVLKQLKPIYNKSVELQQLVRSRFQREAATLEMLGAAHEQIPCLYAYFQEAEQFYLVQEWIEGITLAQRVQQSGQQSEQVVQEILGDLLEVIATVHAKGIVHRDIKPENIILRRQDQKPVLIDFGAVKETMTTVMHSQAGQTKPADTRSIVVGTPGYMPIEQLAGRPVYASDLYSLGLTAIYMLTGKQPQEIETDPASGQLLWKPYAPHVSDSFSAFLETAIHTTTQSRFKTAQAMRAKVANLAMTAAPTQISSTQISSTQSPFPAAAPMTQAQSPETQKVASASADPLSSNKSLPQENFPKENLSNSNPAISFDALKKSEQAYSKTQSQLSSSTSTRNALIIGGLVSLSILIGSVFIIKSLSSPVEPTLISSPSPNSEPFSPSVDPSTSPTLAPATSTPSPASEVTPPITIEEPVDIEESIAPLSSWEFMGTAASGERLLVNVGSIFQSGNSVEFEYQIGDELIFATADCSGNRWHAESYGWYSPQSNATQAMMNFVCQ